MSKTKIIVFLFWLLSFSLSVFFIMIIPTHYSKSVISTLVFDAIAYLSVLILWINLFKRNKKSEKSFYNFPEMLASAIYLLIQLVFCIIVGLLVDVISFKMSLILNVTLMAMVWLLILPLALSKDHLKRVDSRQVDHHDKT